MQQSEPPQNFDALSQPEIVKTVEPIDQQGLQAPDIIPQVVIVTEVVRQNEVPSPAAKQSREVSLSRPGLRRPNGGVIGNSTVGGCLSQAEREKALPQMLVDAVEIFPKENKKDARRTHSEMDRISPTIVLAEETPNLTPPIQPLQSLHDHQIFDGVKTVSTHVDIDAVYMEAMQELQCDESYALANQYTQKQSEDADNTSSLGLNDLIGIDLNEDVKVASFGRPRTIDRPSVRRGTPSTCSSGWSLGTTVACRVPNNNPSTHKENRRFCCDDDDDAPMYFDGEYVGDAHESPQKSMVVPVVHSEMSQVNESFVSTNTMTTVAIDETCGVGDCDDEDYVAQLCLTSRPWHQPSLKRSGPSQKVSEDVKEIVLYGRVGFTTSISISFRNKRSRGTLIQAKAILHRFEPSTLSADQHAVAPADTFRAVSDGSADASGAMSIAPDDKVNITIEFAPFQEGIYSGVLKIRSKKKVR